MILRTKYETKKIEQTMHYKNEAVLEYKISYPVFESAVFFAPVQRINRYYKDKAMAFERYCRTALYRMACESAEYAKANSYPVMLMEAVQNFEVTYNENCALSLYFDRYIFTGGAHGTTERFSQSWELAGGGSRLALSELFKKDFDDMGYIKKKVIEEIKKDKEIYFDDFEQNVNDTLSKENFYITPKALAIYFQQYAIAPYSSGTPVFLIPYEKTGAMPPRC